MARLSLPSIFLLAGLLAIASNAGVAEAWWWSGWRWDCLFPRSGRGYGQSRSEVASIDAAACPARGLYNYTSFLRAAAGFPGFGGDGDAATRKREVASFLAQISHETTGGWATAPDGPFAWGLCFKEEIRPPSNYCDASNTEWPSITCFPGKSYHGRGPIQLSWNFNYGPAGKALGFDGLREPEVVATDPDVAFKTVLWFWMTPRAPKLSCHDVMVGRYRPSPGDLAANRAPGFGLTTNIINGGIECGPSGNAAPVADRIGFFRRYCGMLGVDVGPNLDCARQEPY
ncbi:hypothetical protein PVAP13_3NG195052 [Panicum virgatum]|uniref:chitinase n=1 Tax=Panicum virgatum TaxID=38727 RepID=A0A8T0U5I2_PANVG|nr:hypothetical protein PVAP13_3NG195052 [Panicum virgatum]